MTEETSRHSNRENGRRSGESHGHRHRSSGKRRLGVYLWIIVFIETATLLFLVSRIGIVEKENNDLSASEKSLADEMESMRPEFEKLKADMDKMVRERLPGLIYIEFDKVIPVNLDYIKNIVFTVSGTKDSRKVEYKLLLENGSSYSVTPKLELLFFDKVGIQQGISKIGFEKDPGAREILERGETRSFSDSVDLEDGAPPEYFIAKILK
jgi:hypothetical protein